MIHQKILAGEPVNLLPSGPDEARTIDAAWVVDAVARNVSVMITGGIVRGALNLKYMTVGREFLLENCSIADAADFSYTDFKYSVQLQQTTFRQSLAVRGAVFEQSVNLDFATLLAKIHGFSNI